MGLEQMAAVCSTRSSCHDDMRMNNRLSVLLGNVAMSDRIHLFVERN